MKAYAVAKLNGNIEGLYVQKHLAESHAEGAGGRVVELVPAGDLDEALAMLRSITDADSSLSYGPGTQRALDEAIADARAWLVSK